MSQEKVDKYKSQKIHRKSIMKKEKRRRVYRTLVASVIGLVVVGWIGYSAFDMYESSKPRKIAEVDYASVAAYLETLNAEQTAE